MANTSPCHIPALGNVPHIFYTQFEPWMSVNINNLDLHFTFCYKSQWMEIIPVPTCCKLHFHNYTCIPFFFRAAGDPIPYWSACYGVFWSASYGVFSIRHMYTAWSVIMVFSLSDLYMTVYSRFSYCPPPWQSHWGDIEMLGVRPCVRPSVRPSVLHKAC